MPKIIESNIYSLGNGYYVTIGGGKQYIYEPFTVEKYGNTTKALEAARKFRDITLKERSTSSVKGFFKPKELIESIKKLIKRFKIKDLNFEGKEKNLTRLAEVAGVKTIPDPDPMPGSGRILYAKPTKQIVETIKANLVKAPATQAGEEAFLKREARATELLESGKHTQADVNRILGEEFPEVKGMKSTISKLSKTIKGIPSGTTGKEASGVKGIIQDLKNLDKSRVRSILESGKYTLDGLITRIKNKLTIDEGLAITRLGQLLEAYEGNTFYIDRSNTKIDKIALQKLKAGITQGSLYGGIGGGLKRKRYERKVAAQIGEKPSYFPGLKKRAQELIPGKGWEVDLVKSIASSGRFGTGPYSIFLQGLQSKINAKKGSTLDKYVGTAEKKLQNLDPDTGNYIHKKSGNIKTPEQIKNKYNTQVDDFLKTANKDLKPGELPIKAMHLSWDKPSKTIRNQKGYNQFKTIFDDIHKKYGYSFEVDKDLKTTFELKDFLKSKAGQLQISKFMKSGAGRIFGPIVGVYLGYQGVKTLFNTPVSAEIPDQVPGAVVDEQVTEVVEPPITDEMTYNATEGKFVEANGDPADQSTVLNWIADHPTASGFAALPGAIGLGYIADQAAAAKKIPQALGAAGRYMMSWKVGIPAMMIPHKLHEWKRGDEPGELITDPWNALWAVGIRSPKQMGAVKAYYDDMLNKGRQGLNMSTLKNLKSVQGWKNLPGAFKTALMSPAATGTNWAMGQQLRKPFVGAMKALDKPAAAGIGALAKRIGLRAALLPLGVLGAVPAGIATLGFLAADFAYGQYKDWRDGKEITNQMLKRGSITQEDADNYMSLIKQGSLPFGLGNRMFGSDNMNIAGVDMNPEQQRNLLGAMEDEIDVLQQGRQTTREKFREDDFDFGDPGGLFSEGGRVGMKFGGDMGRREFMKWLLGIAVAGGAALKGVWKPGMKKVAEEVAKQIPKEFAGVPGMPEWFFRAVQKIKAGGKLIEMADKHYVQGDMYEMMLPIKVRKFDTVAGKEVPSGWKTEMRKVTLEENPLDGTIGLSWKDPNVYGGIDVPRFINYKPGQAGFQKFGVDDAEAAAHGIKEYRRVKVEEPEFEYGQPDYASQGPEDTAPDSAEFLDIFTEGDDVVAALEKLAGKKVITKETEAAEKEIQKNLYKDIQGEEAIIPEPEGVGISDKGDVYGEEGYSELIEGAIPDHLLKKKAEGGIIETGNIARRPGAVPPLSGPTPQGSGIVGLFSNPKQVNVRL